MNIKVKKKITKPVIHIKEENMPIENLSKSIDAKSRQMRISDLKGIFSQIYFENLEILY